MVSLKSLIKIQPPDFVALVETYMENNKEIDIKGFKPFSKNRGHNEKGGISILINENIKCKIDKLPPSDIDTGLK